VKTPHIIAPTAIYSLEAARVALGLAQGTLPREIRLGRLRVAKRAGRCFVMGEWLIAWVKAGEVSRSATTKAVEEGNL
jgi:hypothetical protein